jgi:hypothetical protein
MAEKLHDVEEAHTCIEELSGIGLNLAMTLLSPL